MSPMTSGSQPRTLHVRPVAVPGRRRTRPRCRRVLLHHVTMSEVEAMFAPQSLARTLGFTHVETTDGRSVVEVKLAHSHDNQAGVTHGGTIFALADTAVGLASSREGGPVPLGVGFSLQMLRTCRAGDRLRATATEQHRGKTLVSQLVQVTRVRDGALVATVGAQLLLRELPLR